MLRHFLVCKHFVQVLARPLGAGRAPARPSTLPLAVLLLVLGCLLLFGGLKYILGSRKQVPVTGWARVIDGDSLMVCQAAWYACLSNGSFMHRRGRCPRAGEQRQRQAAGHRRAGEGAVLQGRCRQALQLRCAQDRQDRPIISLCSSHAAPLCSLLGLPKELLSGPSQLVPECTACG